MSKHLEKSTDVTVRLMQEMKEALSLIYGDNLRGLYLYGSRARQEGVPESDVDVLIVLKNFEDYWEEIQRTSHIISGLSLKYDVAISPVRLREADWLEGDSPFLKAIRSESVPA